ncbi:CinA family protein [Eionea flava]
MPPVVTDCTRQLSEVEHIAAQFGEQLLITNSTVTTAESCTGGGIAQAITAVPGSSQWFDQGYVTYSNHAKQQLLGVSQQALSQGAVSEVVVEAMALGALSHARADISIAVSGIAGPGGGSVEKPVGTVWIAWAKQPKTVISRCYHFTGDRAQVRLKTIVESLKEALRLIDITKNTV